MNNKFSVLLTTLAVGLFSFQSIAIAAEDIDGPPVEAAMQLVSHEELQTRLLNTLDNAEGIAAGIGLSEAFADQIKAARERLLWATPEEMDAIPVDLYDSMGIIEVSTGNIRLIYDPALRKANPGTKNPGKSGTEQTGPGISIQSTGASYNDDALDEPDYPNEPASTQSFERKKTDPDDDTSEGTAEVSACNSDGTPYRGRAASMNAGLVLDAIRNVMGAVCNQTLVANASLACIPFEIAADVVLIVDANLALCNEHNGAAEVSATWQGLKTVHGNVQHVHDDVAGVDSNLSVHDTTVKNDISVHDSDIKLQITEHDTNMDADLAAHDSNIDADLAAHDTNIDGDLIQHDSDLKSQLAVHDATIKSQLATHDADIKALLGDIQATVDENQRLIKVSMSRQAEVMRLLITPQGQRDINSDVLTCTGDDCPATEEILSCDEENGWACK